MAFEISSGRISRAQKVCIYGVEGVGKSTFASHFPGALFIDTEGSTGNMDVRRLPKPTSWEMLGAEMNDVLAGGLCKTLIIDTIDWAESLCIEHILAKYGKTGIEDFGYGNGYVYEKEEFARFLNKTEELIAAGIHVVLTAHAQLRKFAQPDEIGEYDRYELKLGKKTGSQISPLIKEWADLLLFANYKTMAVAIDKEGKKFKAQGNARVMYTEHHPCWDAKNRHGLQPELPFDFAQIAYIFPDTSANPSYANASQEKQSVVQDMTQPSVAQPSVAPPSSDRQSVMQAEADSAQKYWFDGEKTYITSGEKPQSEREVFEIGKQDYEKLNAIAARLQSTDAAANPQENANNPTSSGAVSQEADGIPKALADLMNHSSVTENEIRRVVAQRGYFPEQTPIRNYPKDFISGVLVAAWEQVFAMIKQNRDIDDMPF